MPQDTRQPVRWPWGPRIWLTVARIGWPSPQRSLSGDGYGKLNWGSFRRVAIVSPDPVQLVLVVERIEVKNEGKEQADNRNAGRFESGRALHSCDPLASPVDRDERRDDDDPPEQHGNHRHGRAHHDPGKVPGFAVHFVIPD